MNTDQSDPETPSAAAAGTSAPSADSAADASTSNDEAVAAQAPSDEAVQASANAPDQNAPGAPGESTPVEETSEPNAPEPSNETAAPIAPGPAEPSEQTAAGESSGGAAESAPAAGEPTSDANQPAEAADGAKKKKKKKRRRKKKKPGEEHARPATDRAPFHVGEEVFGKVTAVLEPAIMIDLGGKALAIFDRTEMEPDDLVPSVGDRFVARVHNDGARGGLVVLTRKPLREEETKPFVEQAAKDGTLVQGLITGVIKGGVEVDVGGIRAFAPASGMDLHPSQANFASLLGQRMEFKVVHFKNAGRDVVVTRRPMLEAEAHERRKHALTLLEEGQVKNGVVRTVVEWGAFVALPEAENLEGLVHISEASHDPRAKMSELLSPGEKVEVKITKIDERGKIWLSRRALLPDPWGEARQKYSSGSKHTGKVVRIEDFGAFITLEDGVDGLLHVADLAFDRIEHPNKVLTVGQDVDVVVHNFDNRNKRIALHPAPPPERADEQPQKVSRGATVKVEVAKPEQAGLVVRVLGATGRQARGFIPAGQTGTARGTDLRKAFKQGTQLDVKVLDVDPRRGEPKLSIRALKDDEERKAHRDYRQKLAKEAKFGTLGDLLAKKLNLQSGDKE